MTFEPELFITESESEESNHPCKKQNIELPENTIITENKSPKKIKNLKNEGNWREQILAARSPRPIDDDEREQLQEIPVPERKRERGIENLNKNYSRVIP